MYTSTSYSTCTYVDCQTKVAHVFIAVATDDNDRRLDCGMEMEMELVLV